MCYKLQHTGIEAHLTKWKNCTYIAGQDMVNVDVLITKEVDAGGDYGMAESG